MASLTRRIQRGVKRGKTPMHFYSAGCKLGVHNEEATDLVARLKREENRK